jgi:hypothetical protein
VSAGDDLTPARTTRHELFRNILKGGFAKYKLLIVLKRGREYIYIYIFIIYRQHIYKHINGDFIFLCSSVTEADAHKVHKAMMGKNYRTEYELRASDDEEWKADDDFSDEVEEDQSA